MWAQALAVFAANCFHRYGQQNLLTQSVFEQHAVTLIVAYLSLGGGDRKLCPAGVGSKRSVQQVKAAREFLHQGLQAAGARQFEAGGQVSVDPDVLDCLVLTVTLLDQLGASGGVQRATLLELRSKVDHTRAEILFEVDGMDFQLLNFDEHRHLT